MTQERTKKLSGSHTRVLRIDFDLYTEGDAAFKAEMIDQMIKGVAALQQSAISAMRSNERQLLAGARHRAAFTLAIINDVELDQAIEKLKAEMQNGECRSGEVVISLCDEIIAALKKEGNSETPF